MIKHVELKEVPHFQVTTVDGALVRYADIWQHRNLVLVVVPGDESAAQASYVATLGSYRAEFTARRTELVITRDPVPAVFPHGVVVADQWGEVTFAVTTASVAQLPNVEEILEWVDYTRMRCPECEGERR